jgi:hypothetical protein
VLKDELGPYFIPGFQGSNEAAVLQRAIELFQKEDRRLSNLNREDRK